MSTSGEGPTNPEVSEVGAGGRRRAAVVQAVVALAFCGGAFFWSWRVLWDHNHPVLTAARGLQARSPSDRIAAVNQLTDLGFRHRGESLHCLVPALGDPDAGVRAAAARSLGLVGTYVAGSEAEAAAMADVWAGLLGLLKDREAEVRGAAAASLGSIVMAVPTPGGSGRGSRQGGEKAGPALDLETAAEGITGLLQDRDASVRLAAISAMGSMASRVSGGPPRSLLAAMEDESPTNRAAAVTAMVNYRSGLDPLIPILLEHLAHDEPSARVACIDAMGRIRPTALTSAVAPH